MDKRSLAHLCCGSLQPYGLEPTYVTYFQFPAKKNMQVTVMGQGAMRLWYLQ